MKFSSSVVLFFVIMIYGCKAIDELTHFDIDYNYTFTLNAPPNGINLDNLDIRSNDVENSNEATFENNDTRKDLIESALLKKFVVTILQPENYGFSFLNKVEVFLKTSELEEKLVAWKDNIEDIVGNQLELETTSSNLRKYLISDKIKVRLKTTSSEPLTEDLLLDLKAKVEVDAKILGI